MRSTKDAGENRLPTGAIEKFPPVAPIGGAGCNRFQFGIRYG
ncbi:hypothetical protein KKY_3106 [Pelagibacterium halotolerans B2]|uniref:Uncharacterized protein n=1 Tax=Pelagibacterium halotolerans (strain DSM 22347 / JCM 15775 / CGMCC 1.7692 / B2) TaxID=1082931 RepID=G4RGC1_PELHB|nr:hypothetical protein KKY_3106 [Pelagibacterium halotolerans B2]